MSNTPDTAGTSEKVVIPQEAMKDLQRLRDAARQAQERLQLYVRSQQTALGVPAGYRIDWDRSAFVVPEKSDDNQE